MGDNSNVSNIPKTESELLIKYVNSFQKIITFLNKKTAGDVDMTKAKNLFVVAKNNEVVLFQETEKIVMNYRKQIADGTREKILEIDFKCDPFFAEIKETDNIEMVKRIITKLQTIVQNMNDGEWALISRSLKDLLVCVAVNEKSKLIATKMTESGPFNQFNQTDQNLERMKTDKKYKNG